MRIPHDVRWIHANSCPWNRVFIGSWISRHYGRRWCVFAMSIYALGSTAVLVSGLTRAQMLTGRSIHCTCFAYLSLRLLRLFHFCPQYLYYYLGFGCIPSNRIVGSGMLTGCAPTKISI